METLLKRLFLGHTVAVAFFFSSIAFGQDYPNAWKIVDGSAVGGQLYYSANNPFHASALSDGFRLSATFRMSEEATGSKAMALIYGLDTDRYLLYFDLDASGDLVVEIEGYETVAITTDGTGSAAYHTHEIVYTNGSASYWVDGELIGDGWTPSTLDWPEGMITWGSVSTPGEGAMMMNDLSFTVAETNEVAAYHAGFNGGGVSDPASNGWAVAGTTAGASVVSPDSIAYPVAPVFTNEVVTEIFPQRATFEADLATAGSLASAWFEWGATTNYGNQSPPVFYLGTTNMQSIAHELTGLAPGTDYHGRLVVRTGGVLYSGSDMAFSTPASISVSSLANSGAGSLRQAITDAGSGDVITFSTNGTIVLGSELSLSDNITIQGPGPDLLTLSGDYAIRVLWNYATNTIIGLTIKNGLAPQTGSGGGVVNYGYLTMSNCVVRDCSITAAANGANATSTGANGGNGSAGKHGGGIYNIGSLELYHCEVLNNSSGLGGNGGSGADGGVGNSPGGNGGHGGAGGHGGGIYSSGTLLLSDSTVNNNTARRGGFGGAGGDGVGAVNADGGDGGNGGNTGWGAGIYATGPVTINRSFFYSNDPGYRSNEGSAGSVGVSGSPGNNGSLGAAGRGAAVAVIDAALHVDNTTLEYNGISGSYTALGGGIYCQTGTLVINGATITGNGAGNGGGIYKTGSAIQMTNSIVCLNSGSPQANVYITVAGTNNLIDVNPELLPIGDYGGPTLSRPPLLDSPAVNAGSTVVTNISLIDQRGFDRTVGLAPDIGAVELQDPAVPVGVTTLSAVDVDPVRATIRGEFNPQGGDSWLGFEWGTTTNYGNATTMAYSRSSTTVPRDVLLNNLTPGETIHYRSVLRNQQGYSYGSDMQFTLPTTFIVDSLSGGSGIGTFKQALADAHDGTTIAFATSGTISGSGYIINDNITIIAPGPDALILDANGNGRVLKISFGKTVEISGLTVREGATFSDDKNGAGIYNQGTLTLSNCVVEANQTYDGPTGSGGENGQFGGDGGGINNLGTLTLRDCIVRNNSSGNGGWGRDGADGASGSPNGSHGGNGGNGGDGGGIYSSGVLTLINCKIHNNTAGYGSRGGLGGDGGGIGGNGGDGGNGGNGGWGGGIYIYSGTVVIDGCDFYGNRIYQGGSGWHGGDGQIGFDTDGGNGGDGGDAGSGGGIAVVSSSVQLGITNSTFRNHQTITTSGASGGSGGANGGLGTPGNPGQLGKKGQGGGLFASSSFNGAIWNSTFFNNKEGGIVVSPITVINSTVVSNQTGGVRSSNVTLTNSVVSGNTSYDISVGATTFAYSSQIGSDPMLAPMGDYGGSTLSMPPLPGSPLINAGLNSVTNVLATDQRGFARRSGSAVDIGAAEFQEPVVPWWLAIESAGGLGFTNGPAIHFSVMGADDLMIPPESWSYLGPAQEVPVGSGIYEFNDPMPSSSNRFYRVDFP